MANGNLYKQGHVVRCLIFACLPYAVVLGVGKLRVTSAICDEGATLLDKAIGQLAVRKPITSHPCVGG